MELTINAAALRPSALEVARSAEPGCALVGRTMVELTDPDPVTAGVCQDWGMLHSLKGGRDRYTHPNVPDLEIVFGANGTVACDFGRRVRGCTYVPARFYDPTCGFVFSLLFAMTHYGIPMEPGGPDGPG